MVYFRNFQRIFGEDGNVLAIGLKNDKVYQLDNFRKLHALSQKINQAEGVSQVLSLPLMYYLDKDTLNKQFVPRLIFENFPQNQARLDSLLGFALNQRFYQGLLVNPENGATAILISIKKEVLNSSGRQTLIRDIEDWGQAFSAETGIDLHYAGIPFVRSIVTGQVASELQMLLVLSAIATAVILFAFFGSWVAVVFSMIIIGVVVVWCVGFLGIFGYQITILTGLLPPILVVIGIPNCVYLLNKYHQEYRIHGNQMKALSRIINKIGVVALITNATTAIGFAVFIFMDHANLKEFGIISSLCILCTFLLSITLLPIFYSFLPPPSAKAMRHLDRRPLTPAHQLFSHKCFRLSPNCLWRGKYYFNFFADRHDPNSGPFFYAR
ncbi:MAG: MMPL family transporter [Bacteroidia bacterium]|nr:MMPL family transporter [Bacteroidia bacterium]